MFAFFSPYKILIEAVAIGGLILAIAFGIHHFLSYEQNIGYQKAVAEYTAKELIATQAARAREQQLAQQLSEAQNAAQVREQTIKTLASAASVSSSGLRDTLASINRGVPTADLNSLRESTRSFGAVIGKCQDALVGMANKFEQANSDKRTLIDAWPK